MGRQELLETQYMKKRKGIPKSKARVSHSTETAVGASHSDQDGFVVHKLQNQCRHTTTTHTEMQRGSSTPKSSAAVYKTNKENSP